MINDIINAIGKSLNKEFGKDYKIYSENIRQDFSKSCFFIECVEYARDKAISTGNRFSISTVFKITYFSDEQSLSQNEDIWNIADRIFDAIEYVDKYSGNNIKAEFSDGVLVITVNYDFQGIKKQDNVVYMDRLKQK